MLGLLEAWRQYRDSEPGEEGIPGRVGRPVRERGRDNIRNELGEGLAPRPTPVSYPAIARLPVTFGVSGPGPDNERGRRPGRHAALRRQVTTEPGMAVLQVLAHVAPYAARVCKIARTAERVIGFHRLSIALGTDIGQRSTGRPGDNSCAATSSSTHIAP
jgi:hypothetical protein